MCMNPLNPKVGDLVQTIIQSDERGLPVYEWWGGKSVGFPPSIGNFKTNDIGLVLESLEQFGGNGCKILFCGDKIGWVNINYLKRLCHETR